MEEDHFSVEDLEKCSYRYLQQKAKSMHLPSNVKKIYLIQLIYAKRYRPTEVNGIVERVKEERLQVSLLKKKNRKKQKVQDAEISSTSQSPPILMTPRPTNNLLIRYSPKQTSRHDIINLRKRNQSPERNNNGSDRVLRSFNIKTRKSNYRILNSVISVLEAENDDFDDEIEYNHEKHIKTLVKKVPTTTEMYMQRQNIPIINKQDTSIIKFTIPNLNSTPRFCLKKKTQNTLKIYKNKQYPVIIKTAQKDETSGIKNCSIIKPLPMIKVTNSNLDPKLMIKKSRKNIMTVDLNKTGRNLNLLDKNKSICTVIVNKKKAVPSTSGCRIDRCIDEAKMQLVSSNQFNRTPSPPKRQHNVSGIYPLNNSDHRGFDFKQIGLEFRGIDGKLAKVNAIVAKPLIDENTNTTEYTADYAIDSYPNMSAITEFPNTATDMNESFNEESVSVYREPMRVSAKETEDTLPKINAVFSKFNSRPKDITQPLYVQVSEESERLNSYPIYVAKPQSNISLLETLYNFKNQFLTTQPLLQIATTSNTRCVQSTPIITTPMEQTASFLNHHFNMPSCAPPDDFNVQNLRSFDFTRNESHPVQRRHFGHLEELSMSSSLDTSQDLGANVTIPEMVEDALEIISQDGDYMERIGMDVRMQCILCNWAGPTIILEYHIRKEHSDKIKKSVNMEWKISYSLGELVQKQVWSSEVIDDESSLYIVSAKYEEHDCFMSSLTTLTTDLLKTGTITVYNKVSGEPFTWHGDIPPLPTNMPYENTASCLKLDLTSLNLLPNSANLTLINRELVLKSPGRVVMGQPELDNIFIDLFITLY